MARPKYWYEMTEQEKSEIQLAHFMGIAIQEGYEYQDSRILNRYCWNTIKDPEWDNTFMYRIKP